MDNPRIAIIDYGLGNLFSIQRALECVGAAASITADPKKIESADGVVLPGVGAFGDAIDAMKKLGLDVAVKETVRAGKPLMGVCLGMQLLMSESYEFGRHQGLDLIKGSVVRFQVPQDAQHGLIKVPQVGWNRISTAPDRGSWEGTSLEGIPDGEFMYFVHSYYVKPEDASVCLSVSQYGGIEFCSSLLTRNIFAVQYHPERSAAQGIQIYRNFAAWVSAQKNAPPTLNREQEKVRIV